MPTHGWVTQWHIATGIATEMHPVTAASPRNNDRITTILLEDFEHIRRSKHDHLHRNKCCARKLPRQFGGVGHRKNYSLTIKAVVFVAHQHSDRPVGLLCLGKGY